MSFYKETPYFDFDLLILSNIDIESYYQQKKSM